MISTLWNTAVSTHPRHLLIPKLILTYSYSKSALRVNSANPDTDFYCENLLRFFSPTTQLCLAHSYTTQTHVRTELIVLRPFLTKAHSNDHCDVDLNNLTHFFYYRKNTICRLRACRWPSKLASLRNRLLLAFSLSIVIFIFALTF